VSGRQSAIVDKALTPAELELLRLVGALRPWGNRKSERKVGAYLDGDAAALDDAPTLRGKINATIDGVTR
jgi:hypothetical protein